MENGVETTFSLVIGGPFYRLQQRMGLLGPDLLPHKSTALLFAAVAWLCPALLSAWEGNAWNNTLSERSFLLDYSAYARFILVVVTLTMMESVAEVRIAALVRQFLDSGLFDEQERDRFTTALRRADRRTSSTLGEIGLLAISFVIAVAAGYVNIRSQGSAWFGELTGDGVKLTLAGWWALLISLPLFWFLVLRWLWRFVAWTILLRDVSRLRLRLVATHPDRCAGLGFLELFPITFTLLAFALSCVSASVVLQEMQYTGIEAHRAAALFAAWLLTIVGFIVGPLLVFIPVLVRVKEDALLRYGRLSCMHNRAFERQWVDGRHQEQELLGVPDISSLADLAAGFEAVRSMRFIPAGHEVVMVLGAAVALPWLSVLLTQIPVAELLSAMAKAVL